MSINKIPHFSSKKVKRKEAEKNREGEVRNPFLGEGVVLCMGAENEEGVDVWLIHILGQALLSSLY